MSEKADAAPFRRLAGVADACGGAARRGRYVCRTGGLLRYALSDAVLRACGPGFAVGSSGPGGARDHARLSVEGEPCRRWPGVGEIHGARPARDGRVGEEGGRQRATDSEGTGDRRSRLGRYEAEECEWTSQNTKWRGRNASALILQRSECDRPFGTKFGWRMRSDPPPCEKKV